MSSQKRFSQFSVLMLAAATLGLSLPTVAMADTVEVLLGQVFIPETGYGSNNNVELTLDGYLPNSCYQLGKASIDTQDGGHTFVVHQFAELQTTGVCAPGAVLPPQLADVVPYTYNVSIGRLAAGSYKVDFNPTSQFPGSKTFSVYASQNLTADDFPYAAISTINMPDVVNGLHHVTATLIGSLTSTCSFLSDVKITQENDVIVVQPILGHRQGVLCGFVMLPLKHTIDLGKLGEGRYLLHVRSANGNSVSHAFSVLMPDPS